jgi:NSS family neurotransmitter:Na+ symporter
METLQNREQWGSKLGFILAAAGSAIGLGNIWRFPTTAGDNGGGLFVLIYIFCVLVIGVPVMLAEFSIGRAAQTNPVGAFRKLAPGTPWFAVGGMGVLAGFMILSFYAVVGGWILGYMVDSIRGALFAFGTPEALLTHFNVFAQDPTTSIGYLFIFMAATIYIVYSGIGGGIERWSKILMPILFVLLLVVIVSGLLQSGAMRGLEFLLVPRFEDFKPTTLAAALGQAFFSLSLGMGTMITYGSYLRKDQNLPNSSLQVAGLDTLIAVLAGLAIFPAIFSLNPSLGFHDAPGGEGLIFVSFPQIFMAMFGGNALAAQLFGAVFFLLVLIAALTSSISLLEVVTAYFVDEKGWARKKASIVMGLIIFVIGIPSALSNVNATDSFRIFGMSFFALIGLIANEYMLPIGGLLISLFVAWTWGRARSLEQVRVGGAKFRLGELYHFVLRWIAPLIIIQIILMRIIDDLRSNKIVEFPGWFLEGMQWAFTALDAVLLLGVLVGGVVLWIKKSSVSIAVE